MFQVAWQKAVLERPKIPFGSRFFIMESNFPRRARHSSPAFVLDGLQSVQHNSPQKVQGQGLPVWNLEGAFPSFEVFKFRFKIGVRPRSWVNANMVGIESYMDEVFLANPSGDSVPYLFGRMGDDFQNHATDVREALLDIGLEC